MLKNVYRIYTEDINRKTTTSAISSILNTDGMTVYSADGIWESHNEASVVYEVITDRVYTLDTLKSVAVYIKGRNLQAAVLITQHQATEYLY